MVRQKRSRNGSSPMDNTATDPRAVILTSSIALMNWRLKEAAARIVDAADAVDRGDHDRAVEHLFEIEPLVFDAQRILSAVFLLAKEIGERGALPTSRR